ncbi:MAG: carboxypeptidase-like regulatory domain-containing protein, partial [Acidobacteria bacterium]|nr:carboxypeptidase-like regulatory domain-containing protein [Acidobacteriota bacterium]
MNKVNCLASISSISSLLSCRTVVTLLALAGVLSADLSAQISGSIEVKVIDATQAAVPGANVRARNVATGTARTAITNDLGVALISQLAIGDYEVKVEAAGFAVYSSTAYVNSGATVTIPITIEVKGAEQTVVVTEAAALINTVNAQLQNSVEAKKIVDLPLSGSSLTLAGMSPGIAPVT